MTQCYIGCKQVEAWPEQYKGDDHRMQGKPGYGIKYPDGYQSWCPKEVFEAAYLPMGTFPFVDADNDTLDLTNENTITQQMVENFIVEYDVLTVGEKTTVVHAKLANGFEIVESSSCVDPANYDEELGAKICLERIENQVWHLLGFALQWARAGLNH